MTQDFAATASIPAPGRSCGSCALCCKVYDVAAVDKPMGQWCRHCKPGSGCAIHATRPEHCRSFHCLWMLAPMLGPEWKPDRARFVLTIDPATRFLLVQVDPGLPMAWRKEPYYSQLKRWSAAGLQNGRQVIVFNDRAATVILPNTDAVLGVLEPDDRVVISSHPLVGGGFAFSAHKQKASPAGT